MSKKEDNPSVNGVANDPLQRLASIKAPRDLSLGGVKPNKKVFTPNLNVTRNKNKGPSTANSREQKKDDRNKKDRNKFDKNKFVKNGPNIIKSSGIFSEGLGNSERRSERTSYGRSGDPAPTLQRPTLRVKDVVKIDKELEEKKIKAAFGDNTSYEDDSEDFKNVLDIEAPVKLPMDDGGWLNSQKAGVKIKTEVVVKQEPTDDDDCVLVDQKPMPDVKEVFEDTNVVDLLRSDKPSLILLQLADSLPGRGGSSGDDRRKNEPSTSTEQEEKQTDNRCRLSELEEGKIGKLRIHRSGRVTLALGDTIFEVCCGTKASFHQEVVSVAADDASRSASLVSLGPLQHKLNITPHWQHMFDNMQV